MKGLILALALLASPLAAQDFTALARIDAAASRISDKTRGVAIDLFLSQPVPFRVFTLTEPMRLVIDFREVDWRGVGADTLLQGQKVRDVRFGTLRPGWSRMVADLAEPLAVKLAGMTVSEVDGTAKLSLELERVDEATFAEKSGAPVDPDWELMAADPTLAPAPKPDFGDTVVVIDPGHGGIDPGAERGASKEADLMLALAQEVAQTLERIDGFQAVLTRSSDIFVPLEERMTIARAAGADVFISLHADALEEGGASGASVYTLSPSAADEASQRMAERHERGDLLAGVDLAGQDDRIATALMDLVRLETMPQSESLALEIVEAFDEIGAPLNSRPRRTAELAVLNAADFPSVLVEVGFLSDVGDRERLSSAIGRAPIVAGLVVAVQRWQAEWAANKTLLRQ